MASIAVASHSRPSCVEENMTYDDESVTGALPNGAFVVNALHCQNLCAVSLSCKAFTYKELASPAGVWPAVPAGGCYLFSAEKTLKAEDGAMSGPKSCKDQHHFKMPFNVTMPNSWFPEDAFKKPPEKKPEEEGPSMAEEMKATYQGLKHKVRNLDVCDGPMCCPGSSCHFASGCSSSRGTTRCIGAGLFPPKFGTCQCVTGACDHEGYCSDAPGREDLERKFEAPGAEAAEGVANAALPRHSDPRFALFGIASVLLVVGLAVVVRSSRRRAERQQDALQETFECENLE
uniref:Apple domain-containing protein n=1 Tax=Alexandrium catenella TaxID=2925 RepID=A0A7S1S3E4_ALECA